MEDFLSVTDFINSVIILIEVCTDIKKHPLQRSDIIYLMCN